jgi:hypothetical protein
MFTVSHLNGFNAAGASPGLLANINDLGLATNLKLCLDAGDRDSYNAAVQTDKWLDRSGGGYDFFRGSGTGADAADPTFNGTAGGFSSGEYWSFDGGDYFTYDTTNETWMQNIHKDNAAVTLLSWFMIPTAESYSIIGNMTNGPTEIGFAWRGNGVGSLQFLIGGNTGSNVFQTAAAFDFVPTASAWTFACLSLNEAANVSLLNRNGTELSDACTYTSPSASSATYTTQIGARGNAGTPFRSTSRLAMLAVWEGTALSASQMASLYLATKGRFGL